MELKRKFIKGVMNKDVDERLIPDGEYIDAVNVDVINSEGSDAGTIRNIKGNLIVSDLDDVTNATVANARTIGAVTDEANNRIYWFVTSDNFDGIYEYDENTGNTARVLESTTGQLAFDADYYITGVNVIDGFLYWTDDLNPPRRVNISFAKSFTVDDDRIDEYINVIVAPPLRAPSIEMTDTGEENNMEDKFLQFAYRYKYRDNQYSALSPFSAVAFIPGTYEFDYASGNNDAMTNSFKEVTVTIETGNRFVEEIQVVVRDTKSLNTYIVETFKKGKYPNPLIPNYSTYSFKFKNNKIYSVLPSDQVTRLFDNVPLKAKAQEIIDRRLIYGNYVQFYDIKDCEGDDIEIDYELSYVSEETTSGTPIQTFRSDRDYEVGIIYGDDYGRFSTVLTNSSESGNDTVYIPPSASDKGNSLVVKINHKAPCFATHYRLVVKENKKSYYNIFPILYYADGVYRYFLINESDKNKFKVGDYLIFKSDGGGIKQDGDRYKVLEYDTKPNNFLGNGEIAGLYFKVKAGSGDFLPSDVSTYTWQGIGSNSTQDTGVFCNQGSKFAIQQGSEVQPYTENPIFYGSGLSNISVSNNNAYNLYEDIRVIIEVTATDKFNYRLDYGNSVYSQTSGNQGAIQELTITGADQPIQIYDISGSLVTAFTVRFGDTSGYTVGDYWTVNCRGASNGFPFQWVSPNNGYGGVAISNLSNTSINSGAIIRMTISETFTNGSNGMMTFTASSRNYENIEEWFYGDQIYNQFTHFDSNGNNRGAERVYFRRVSSVSVSGASGTGVAVNDSSQGSTISGALQRSVKMFVVGYGGNDGCNQNVITVDWKLTQLDNPVIAETEPLEVDDQIYHEITRTFPIENRQHKVRWDYEDYLDVSTAYPVAVTEASQLGINIAGKTAIGQATPGAATTADNIPHGYHVGDILYVVSSSTTYGPQAPSLATGYEVLYVIDDYNVVIDLAFPGAGPVTPGTASLYEPNEGTIENNQNSPTQSAIIKINHPQNENSTYNAYAFGNGLESDRIRDDFNETELQFSPRASIVIDTYEQERKATGLCYSGIYKGDTSINRLNEFNLSKANFKSLDREFGSVQKLFARDTDLLVLQENKTSKVLYGKNLLSDAVGGGQITSVPEVLGTQVPYASDFGISFNPESFAEWGNSIWWCDERRGAVLQMTAGQIVDISKYGMKDYFRDMFRDNPKTQKLGVYDPYRHQYILASNDESSVPCSLSLSIDGQTYPATNPGLEEINTDRPDFYVYSNTSWTCEISYGSGSGWVAGYPASGFGDQAIFLGVADNHTAALRTATLTFTYCGGLTATYTITQSRGKKIKIRPIVSHNGRFTKF